MAVRIVYFVHGTTLDNERQISSGWSDAELSPLGIEQSVALRKQAAQWDFAEIFCSDLQRAVVSAELAFPQHKAISDPRLRECNYGKFNACLSEIVEPLQEKHVREPFPQGESYTDVQKRLADFLQFLKQNYAGKTVAIVAHKAPQLALEVLLGGKTWPQAFATDWRKTGAWQPGWEYALD